MVYMYFYSIITFQPKIDYANICPKTGVLLNATAILNFLKPPGQNPSSIILD